MHQQAHVSAASVALMLLGLAACTPNVPSVVGEGLPAISSRSQTHTISTNDAISEAGVPGTRVSGSYIHSGLKRPLQPYTKTTVPEPDASGALYSVNFVNAAVGDVAKSVLGDILHLNYVIDTSVQGSVTLRTSRPMTATRLLGALEESFRVAGLALLAQGDEYRIVPIAEAPGSSQANAAPTYGSRVPGFGVDVLQLRYVGATDMARVLGSAVRSDVQIKADPSRNVLIVSGTSQERSAVAENVRLFDVDYLAGMSFAFLQVHEASAATVAAGLEQIIGGKGGPLDGVVRLVVLDRLNTILAISPQPKYLEQLRGWVIRLDQADTTDDRKVFVYPVENGRARDLVAAFNQLFGSTGTQKANDGDLADASSPGMRPASGKAISGEPGSGGLNPEQSGGSAGAGFLSGPLPGESAVSGSSGNLAPKLAVSEVNNSILFYGTNSQYRNFRSTMRQLDISPMQVLLEAAVVEVTLTNSLRYGVQYSFQDSHNQILNTVAAAAITAAAPGAAYTFASGQNIKVILDALSSVAVTNVISAPKLLVLNNQQAQIDVGDDVPITTQTSQSTVTTGGPVVSSVEYRETGVILRVTPRVNPGGLVQMDIAQEVSDVAATTSSTLNSPTFSQRKITSTVAIQDGETVALGGLIKDTRSRSRSGIPLLKDIPYVGTLFSHKDDSVTRTELLVLITPHVVQSVLRLRAITDELRSHMGDVQRILGR